MTGSSVVRLDPGAETTGDGDAGEVASSGSRPTAVSADERIAAALDDGDKRRALSLCSRHHGRALGRLCMAILGSQQDAEDVSQETLLDAYHGFDGWRREGSMRAWLMGIARRKCAKLIEKRTRRGAKLRLVHDAEKQRAEGEGTEKAVLRRQRAERAREALEGVRPTEREALILRFGAGLSFREVGLAIGIEEAAARKRVSRAIQHLRQTMQEEGIES